MRKLLPAIALLSLCVTAHAQRVGGSANRRSPTMSASIAFSGGATLSVTYRAVAWAEGRQMAAILDKDNGADARKRFNEGAESTPIGTLTASANAEIKGEKVLEGEYRMSFMVDDDVQWHLVLSSETKDIPDIKIALGMKDTDAHTGRLCVGISAAEADDVGSLSVAFGKMQGALKFTLAASDK